MQGGPAQSPGGLMPPMVGVHPQATYPPPYMGHPGFYGPSPYGPAQAYPAQYAQPPPMPQPGVYPGGVPPPTAAYGAPGAMPPYQQLESSPAHSIQQQPGLPPQQQPGWSAPPGYAAYGGTPTAYGAPPPCIHPQAQPPVGVPSKAHQPHPSPYPVMPESWQFPQAHPPPVYPLPSTAPPSGGTTEEEHAAWHAANKRKAEAKWQYDIALRQQQQIRPPSAKQIKSTSTKSGSQSVKAGGMSGLSGLPDLSGPGLSAMSAKAKIPQYSEADSQSRRELSTTSGLSAQTGKTSTTGGMSLDRFKPPSKGPPLSLRDEYLTRLLRGPRPPPPVQKFSSPSRPPTAGPPSKSGPSTSQSERSSQTNYEHSSLQPLPTSAPTLAVRQQGFRPAKPQAMKRPLPEGLTRQPRNSPEGKADEGPASKKRMPPPSTVHTPSPKTVKAFLGEEEFYNIRTLLINQQEEFMQQVWELHGLYRLQKRKMAISKHAYSKDGRALQLDNPPVPKTVEESKAEVAAAVKSSPAPVKRPTSPLPVSAKPTPLDESRLQSSTVAGTSGQPDNGTNTGQKIGQKGAGPVGMPAPAGACQPPPYFPQPTYPPGLGWPGSMPVGSGTDGVGGSQSHETYMHALMQYYSTASNGKDASMPLHPGLPPHMQMPVHPFQMMGASAPGGPMAMGSYPPHQQPSGEPQAPGTTTSAGTPARPPHGMVCHSYHPHGMPPGQPYPGYEAMLQSWYGPHFASMSIPPREASGSVPKENSGSGRPSNSPQEEDNPSAEKPDTPEDGSTDATGAAQPAKAREANDGGAKEQAPRKSSESGQGKKTPHWWKSPTNVFGAAAISAVLTREDTEVHCGPKYGMKGPAKLARKLLANHIKDVDEELSRKGSRSRPKASRSNGSICSDGSASAPCDA